MHYTYNLAGDVASWTQPVGETITHSISNAQRITQITSSYSDSKNPATLVQSITYAPQGAVNSLQNGCVGTGCTQEQETYDYNNRLQAVRIQLGTSSSHAANSCLVYNYYSGVSNPTSCAVPSQGATGNDGSVVGNFFQDTSNSSQGHTASYSYDNLSRLTTSVATGSATHNLTFSYDRYGNMTCVTNQQTNGPCPNWTFNSSTNRISNSNFTYDAAGNLTQDGTGTGTHTYQWDAEGRMVSVDGVAGQACRSTWTACYVYNALGQRVEKVVGSSYTETEYDLSGEPIAENNRLGWIGGFIPLGSRHLAHLQNAATYFVHINKLGSTAQVTDYSGAVAQDQLFYPFGQNWLTAGTSQEMRFASLRHRDSETTLDPTQFRTFSSNQGRWFSPDPIQGCTSNPQGFNRYGYVSGSPTNRVDPEGLCDPVYDPYCFYGCDPLYGCFFGYQFYNRSTGLWRWSTQFEFGRHYTLIGSDPVNCKYAACCFHFAFDTRSLCNYLTVYRGLLGATSAPCPQFIKAGVVDYQIFFRSHFFGDILVGSGCSLLYAIQEATNPGCTPGLPCS
jgi:RHS repeat-associated protein